MTSPDTPERPRLDLEAEADLARCGALKDFWYVACLSEELPRGRPIARTILGTALVLFRDEHGRPAALRDRCLHRNARLSAGDVFGGRLGCPYHGWVYDASGACVEIPSLGPGQRAEVLDGEGHARAFLRRSPSEVGRLPCFPALEQDGLVFVFMGGEGSTPRRPPFRTPHWEDLDWAVYYMVTRFPNGVTNLVENFMDVPHTTFVHRGWFREPSRKRVPATVRRVDGSVLVTYRQEQDEISGLGRLFNPGGAPMEHTDKFYVPNVTRVDYAFGPRSGYVITSQCTPISATDTLVYTAISYRLPWDLPRSRIARAMRPITKWYTTQVIQQDVRIMGIQRDGLLNGPGGGTFAGTEADLLHAYIESYRSWLLEGARGPGPEDESREIAFWI